MSSRWSEVPREVRILDDEWRRGAASGRAGAATGGSRLRVDVGAGAHAHPDVARHTAPVDEPVAGRLLAHDGSARVARRGGVGHGSTRARHGRVPRHAARRGGLGQGGRDARCDQRPSWVCPKPVRGTVPIALGNWGSVGLDHAARDADEWMPIDAMLHGDGGRPDVAAGVERFRRIVAEHGRDPDLVPISVLMFSRPTDARVERYAALGSNASSSPSRPPASRPARRSCPTSTRSRRSSNATGEHSTR